MLSQLRRLAETAADDQIDGWQALREIVEAISEGFVLFDADDRLAFCNQKYRELYAISADVIVPGNTFEQIVRTGAERGQYANAVGRIDDWVTERVRLHRNPPGPVEQRLGDGRWLRIVEYKTPSGWIAGLRIDITDLKEAEAAVRQSEERYRRLIERTNVIAYSYKVGERDLSYVAPQATKLLGYSLAELARGEFWFEHMHPDDRPEIIRLGELMAQRKQDHSLEYRMITADGREVSVRDIVTFDDGPDGTPVAHGIIIDTTEQKRSEAARRESEALKGTVIESALDAIMIIDGNGTILEFNPAAERIFGYGRAEALGKEMAALIVPPRYRAQHRAGLARVSSGAASAVLGRRVELVGMRADGSEFPVELAINATPIGDRTLYTGCLRDIADRKEAERALCESEQRLRYLVESTDVVPYTWDITARNYIYIGPQVVRTFGYDTQQWTDEAWWLSLVHPDDRDLVTTHAGAFNARPQDEYLEYRMVAADGRTVWVRDIMKIGSDGAGGQIGFGVMIDVTETKAQQEQMIHVQKIEAIGQLTGGIAHDFNNLLTVILGNLELSFAMIEDVDLRDRITRALKAAQRGASLTQRLLAFSRQQALRSEPVDFNVLTSGMEDLLRRTLREDVHIEVKPQPGLWLASADKGQVENALLNLAINSRDAMPYGGKLTVETANVQLDASYVARNPEVATGEYVMLAVTDTGTGMPPEVLARAFDPFFTTKEVGKGTGLGLSMIHGFANQSNGHVKIDSEVGRGTAVRLYLPRCVGPAPAAAGTAQPFDENPRRTATILAVEDDPDLRSLVICQLHKLGYQVLEAADGIKARGILESDEPIDLLFTDVIMPGGITGPALAQLAKRIRPGLKTLFSSGYTEHSVIDQVELDPNAPILWKPYVMADLARAVSEMLDTACLEEHCGQSPGAPAANEGARL